MARSEIAVDEGVLIIAVSSDIGERLALDYLRRGFQVAGTYRIQVPASLRNHPNFVGFKCDVTLPESGPALSSFLNTIGYRWRVLISCVGQLAPIGPFFENDFESWAQSVDLNGVAQLRALHAARPMRCDGLCHVIFFAGGGTNGPFRNYSAYCVGKIALTKMCELLDDENPDLNVFIVGTGWVRTKIHDQTIAAGTKAGLNFERTKVFIVDDEPGTSHSDIAAMIDWGITQGKMVASGRNFSVVHDGWRNGGESLASRLRSDPAKFKLRRNGNEQST